jgi:hypothetical protein
MAYAAVVTWAVSLLSDGMKRWNIIVIETEAAAASAWTTLDDGATNVNQVNQVTVAGETVAASLELGAGVVIRTWKVTRESGTAANTAPMLGRPATPGTFATATKDLLAQMPSAAFQYESPNQLVAFPPTHGRRILSGRSVVDAGADNTIHTHIVLDQVA